MHLSLVQFVQTCIAAPAFLLLGVPQGFLLGWGLDVRRFRSRSGVEQLLWSTALSVPTGLALTNIVGRFLHPSATLTLLLVTSFIGLCLAVWTIRRGEGFARNWQPGREGRIVAAALCGYALFMILMALPLQWHGEIFEPVFSSDWEIRIPLVDAAVRFGVPLHNPFFTFQGQSPPMRYYYYWYSLCAQVVRLCHVDVRAGLVGSSVYSMVALAATFFLCLKYMVEQTGSLRRRCVLVLGLCAVLGLDILPTIAELFIRRAKVIPEMEWWLEDRSPGPLGTVLFAPHHSAGIICGLLALLVITSLREEEPNRVRHWLQTGCATALCFAAMLGTSTFLTIFFALTCVILCLDQLRSRKFAIPAALVLAGVLSIGVSVPYIHEALAHTVSQTGNKHAGAEEKRGLKLELRHNRQAQDLTYRIFKRLHLHYSHGPLRFVYRVVLIPVLTLSELGFTLVVLIWQYRRDRSRRGQLTLEQRVMWMLAGSVGFFFFFISSVQIQAVNDLGIHAGLLLRFVLILWGAQCTQWYLSERRHRSWTRAQGLVIRFAMICAVLGVAGALWQAAVDRAFLILVEAKMLPAVQPFPQVPRPGRIYADVYEAENAVATKLPYDAVTQVNPESRYNNIFHLYQRRRQAAGDMSCEGAFGGDPLLCASFEEDLYKLYSGHEWVSRKLRQPAQDPALMSPAAFARICERTGITVMLASEADRAWYHPDSWVWQEPVLYSNNTVRVIPCPAAQETPD